MVSIFFHKTAKGTVISKTWEFNSNDLRVKERIDNYEYKKERWKERYLMYVYSKRDHTRSFVRSLLWRTLSVTLDQGNEMHWAYCPIWGQLMDNDMHQKETLGGKEECRTTNKKPARQHWRICKVGTRKERAGMNGSKTADGESPTITVNWTVVHRFRVYPELLV